MLWWQTVCLAFAATSSGRDNNNISVTTLVQEVGHSTTSGRVTRNNVRTLLWACCIGTAYGATNQSASFANDGNQFSTSSRTRENVILQINTGADHSSPAGVSEALQFKHQEVATELSLQVQLVCSVMQAS